MKKFLGKNDDTVVIEDILNIEPPELTYIQKHQLKNFEIKKEHLPYFININ